MSLCPSVSLPSAAESPDIARASLSAGFVNFRSKSLRDKEVMVQEFRVHDPQPNTVEVMSPKTPCIPETPV